jgi:RimJ/RimL family protein N-acetyltransferase
LVGYPVWSALAPFPATNIEARLAQDFLMHDTALPLTRVLAAPAIQPREQAGSINWRESLPSLSGRLVTLRELSVADGATLLPLISAPEVARFLSPPPQSLERFTGFIESTLRERRAGRYAGFAVVPHGSETPVGLVQIRQLEPAFRTAEWGIALGSAWWGRGLFQDAAQLMLDLAFQRLRVDRLEARVAAQNARGNRAVEKLGAVAEGLLRSSLQVADGTRHDQVLWAWLTEDWRRVCGEAAEEATSWVH